MISHTTLRNNFGKLAQNSSSENLTLADFLMDSEHRDLIQKYFDNERTVQTTTVGGMKLTLTGALSIGATTATLTASWTYPTVTQLVNFSDGEQRQVLFTNGSTSLTWTGALTGTDTTAISTVGVQSYTIPANISKIKDNTINVGQLKYTPIEIKTRQEWDTVNFLPYTSDIPQYYFIYNGTLSLFPIPSTTGNIITFNYKTRVADLSFADYSTGNVTTATVGSTSIVGTATSWSATGKYPVNTDVSFYNLYLKINPPSGDGIWYPISSFQSDTTLTLASPIINAPAISASTTYTIAQFPLLFEDFHDMIMYGALKVYYSTVVENPVKYEQVSKEYDRRLLLLEEYAGRKSFNVDLGQEPNMVNPNMFYYLPN